MKLNALFPRRAVRAARSALVHELWLEDSSHVHALLDDIDAIAPILSNAQLRQALAAEGAKEIASIEDGVARIFVRGHIMPTVSWMFDALGIDATGIDDIRSAIDTALASSDVDSIRMEIDSPGGVASGIHALATYIAQAQSQKPITAHVVGQCCSAAYWLASQAAEVTAEPGSLIGSIGVYATVEDSSRAYKAAGVDVHVLRSGEHKGVGEPGAPINETQLSAIRELIQSTADMFIDAVASGRGFSRDNAKELADGRVMHAEQAVMVGLIDGIEDLAALHGEGVRQLSMEDQMENKELLERIASLEEVVQKQTKEIEQAKAASEVLAATKASLAVAQAMELIEMAMKDGRITPAMRASVERYAHAIDYEIKGLSEFIGQLPVQTRSHAAGVEAATSIQSASSDEIAVAKLFGITVEQMRAASQVKGVSVDGQLIMRDGSRVQMRGGN